MLRRLSTGLLTTVAFVAPLAATAQEGSSEEFGVMSISLKDVVKPTIGVQPALQGAATPNQDGVGGFPPLSVGENTIWFLDALVNANFADREDESSIFNTDVGGGTMSTATRVGYHWLNGDRSRMYGLNAGYESRPVKSGRTDTGISVTNVRTAFFQQVALNAEAVSKSWTFNAYGLLPVDDLEQKLNSLYKGGAMNTYGLDASYFITPVLHASAGYYYHRQDDAIAYDSEARDKPNNPNIGSCNFLRDDNRQWHNTFTANIGSWKLTVRNSKEFHAGNITFLEKIKPKNAEKHRKELSTVDHTIVIDSGCPPHANRNISNEIKNTKKSFYLINTHGHHDHIMGNLVFRNAGASIIAHINAREGMASLEDFDSSGLPNITFRDKMSLFVDDIVLRLIHLPSAHTNGDLAIWIPKLDILFTGDTFMTESYPLIDLRSGTIRGLIEAVTAMIQITGNDTLIIPGHGNLKRKANGNIEGPKREDLIQYRHMLRTVTAEVERLKKLGHSLQEINAKKPTKEFDQEWGNNLICPENFVSFIYNSLPGKKSEIAPCSDIEQVDFFHPNKTSNPGPSLA